MQNSNTFTEEFHPEPSDIVICASIAHKAEWLRIAEALRNQGYKVEMPDISDKRAETIDMGLLVRQHTAKIAVSKAVLVYNTAKNGVQNYIGGNTFMEMSVAFAYGKQIYIYNDIPNMPYSDAISALNPVILHGDISKIAVQ